MTFEERLAAQLYLERRAHAETRRKLAKAEHDRDRYGRRIRFLQGRHEILAREYRGYSSRTRHSRQLCDLARKEAVG